MELNDRKKAILQAIVDAYIDTAEPIGSRTISKMNDLGLSSATIRNEMADLEEMGYLDQPHSSAGRVPSYLGYRFYVDTLMQRYSLNLNEMKRINDFLKSTVREFDNAIADISKIVSELTQYTTIAFAPRMDRGSIKKFDIIAIDERHFVVVMITNAGLVKNKMFSTKGPIKEETLLLLAKVLNDHIAKKALDSTTLAQITVLISSLTESEDILGPVLGYVSEIVKELLNTEVYLGGVKNIFNYPEFFDLRKARDFIDLLDNKEEMIQAFEEEPEKNARNIHKNEIVKVTIGNENKAERLKEVSVIRADYKLGDKVLGSIGLIGPTRMNYAKTISELDYFVRNLNKILTQMTNTEDNGSDKKE